ncbi:hypothetical protein LZ30DRAFT_694913 [Colletotrichum cereale]|nr:hypothetical protein LZ30DRAFT_694913 [Colletotrichum cereale]
MMQVLPASDFPAWYYLTYLPSLETLPGILICWLPTYLNYLIGKKPYILNLYTKVYRTIYALAARRFLGVYKQSSTKAVKASRVEMDFLAQICRLKLKHSNSNSKGSS